MKWMKSTTNLVWLKRARQLETRGSHYYSVVAHKFEWGPIIRNSIFSVGNGRKIRFWTGSLLWKDIDPCSTLPEKGMLLLWGFYNFWEDFIHFKVTFCTWEAWHGKMFTIDNLKKRVLVMVNRWYLCMEKETADHLIIHYFKSQILLNLVYNLFSVRWVMENTIRRALPLFFLWLVSKTVQEIIYTQEGIASWKLKSKEKQRKKHGKLPFLGHLVGVERCFWR